MSSEKEEREGREREGREREEGEGREGREGEGRGRERERERERRGWRGGTPPLVISTVWCLPGGGRKVTSRTKSNGVPLERTELLVN